MKGYDPACMIKADANVGTNAQKPGNKLCSLTIQMVIKIMKVPVIESASLIFLFCIFKLK